MFKPEEILTGKQYDRLLTSGFIHGDWFHFGVNVFSFFFFGRNIEWAYGWGTLLLIHFSAILGGSLLSLIIHRHHQYRALGASGGVCGVIFASLFLFPNGTILHMFIIPIPTFLYAILFLLASFYGHRKGIGNVGHDAHLGGAIVGLLVTTVLYPQIVLASPGMFVTVLLLSLIILFLLITKPLQGLTARTESYDVGLGGDRAKRYAENRRRNEKLAEIDRLLDKAASNGIHSLSTRERQRLEQLSREVHGRSTSTD